MSDQEFRALVEQVKSRVRIEDVIGKYVKLTRAGSLHKGLCPFRPEKTPSFCVYPDHFFCFGCKAWGDVFTFLMRMNHVTKFMEVLIELARQVGIDVPELTPADRQRMEEARTVDDILTEAAYFYHSQLTDEARAYLHGRGITDESIERFVLGYAAGRGALKKHLLGKGYSPELCYRAGVLKEKAEGSDRSEGTKKTYPVDHLYQRITFPYMVRGRAGGIIGRCLNADIEPKYLGLPIPKDHLYNEDVLMSKDVCVFEGPPDCIIGEQHGYRGVALAGTTLKAEHLPKFQRCDRVFLVLDPDKSGQDAVLGIADLLKDKARIVSLPAGKDPDEFLLEHGKPAFDGLLESAPDVISYLLRQVSADTGKVELTKKLDPVLRRLAREPRHVAEAYLTDNMKGRFHWTRDDIAAYREVVNTYRREMAGDGGKGEVATTPTGDYTASFEGLVDLVEQDGTPAFLVKDPESGAYKVSRRWVTEDDTKVSLPPPIEQIPWLLPDGNRVLQSIEGAATRPTAEIDHQLFADLKVYHKRVSELPSEEHYDLLAAFDMHTYLLESFQYTPVLCLHADPEKGKTRTAKGIIYVARRGVHIESMREASIIRYANNLQATLLFDVRDLWKKAEAQGSEDILLLRFEKGATVARVMYPDRGAFHDTVYYEVFGPTIIATNEAVDRILETRAISVSMPETSRIFEADIRPETGLPLKERLLAFRARHLGASLPECDKPASGRLGDILKPILQVLLVAAPDRVERFKVFVEHLQRARLVEKADTLEARIINAVNIAETSVENNKLPVEAILTVLNAGKSEKYWFKSESIGKRLRGLGFEKTRTSDGHSAIVWDDAFVKKLCVKYGLRPSVKPSEPSEPSDLSELTLVQWPDDVPAGATSPDTSEGSDSSDSSEGFTDVYVDLTPTPPAPNGNGHKDTPPVHPLDHLSITADMEDWADSIGFDGDLRAVTEEFLIGHRSRGSSLSEADLIVDWLEFIREGCHA